MACMYVRASDSSQALAAATYESPTTTTTTGRAIFASGSPFEPVTIHDKTFKPSQCNNMYVRLFVHTNTVCAEGGCQFVN